MAASAATLLLLSGSAAAWSNAVLGADRNAQLSSAVCRPPFLSQSVAVSQVRHAVVAMKDEPRGFGVKPRSTPPKKAAKAKTEGSVKKDKAAEDFEKLKSTGAPEYVVSVRTVGESGVQSDWMAVGAIAVPRSSSEDMAVSMAIFNNEDDLLKGAFKLYPKLKVSTDKFEYGYKLKEFPDDPVKVATKEKTEQPSNPLMQWFNQLDRRAQ